VSVFDTPHETATNSACQFSDHGILFIFFIINCQTLFQYSFSLSHSICLHLENESLEELVSCNDTSVNWRYQHHWFIPFIIIIIICNLHTCLCRYKMLPDVFISYWFSSFSCNHRISSRGPSLVPTVRLLALFLLQSWFEKLLTSLGNAWFHENTFWANLCHSQTYHQSVYCPNN